MKPVSFLLLPMICPEELRLSFLVWFFLCLIFALGHYVVEENFLSASI